MKKKNDPKNKNDYTDRPQAEYWNPELCPTCGNNEFNWGDVFDGDIQKLHFRKEGGFLGQGKVMKARQCTRCGNVQMFAEQS